MQGTDAGLALDICIPGATQKLHLQQKKQTLLRACWGLVLQSDWNIVKRGYEAHVLGEAPCKFTDPEEAIKELRVRSESGCAALL